MVNLLNTYAHKTKRITKKQKIEPINENFSENTEEGRIVNK
jgi:hypothetical protein